MFHAGQRWVGAWSEQIRNRGGASDAPATALRTPAQPPGWVVQDLASAGPLGSSDWERGPGLEGAAAVCGMVLFCKAFRRGQRAFQCQLAYPAWTQPGAPAVTREGAELGTLADKGGKGRDAGAARCLWGRKQGHANHICGVCRAETALAAKRTLSSSPGALVRTVFASDPSLTPNSSPGA